MEEHRRIVHGSSWHRPSSTGGIAPLRKEPRISRPDSPDRTSLDEDSTTDGSRGTRLQAVREFLSRFPLVVCVVDRPGRIHFVNPAAETFFGYEAAELTGHRILELIHPDDRRPVVYILGRTSRSPTRHVVRCEHRDGGDRLLEWTPFLDPEGGGGPFRLSSPIVVIGRDVTGERSFRELERTPPRIRGGFDARGLEDLFERAPVGIVRVAPDQRVVAANPAGREIVGAAEGEEILGSNVARRLFSDPRDFRLLQERLFEEGVARGMDVRLRHPGLGRRRVLLDACRVRASDGRHRFDELFIQPLDASREPPGVPNPSSFRTPVRGRRRTGSGSGAGGAAEG